MIKWDGHTHTQFCRHGSGDKTAAMVERAIELEFDRYSITEHAPLPEEVVSEPQVRAELGLTWDEIDDYFAHIKALKEMYGGQIEILAGLEVDYLAGFESFSERLLEKYENLLEDTIVSAHFISLNDQWHPIDYSLERFKELVGYFGSVDDLHLTYWDTIKRLVNGGLRGLKNKRLGHLGIINKFSKEMPTTSPELESPEFFEELFKSIKNNGWAVDFNVAGINYEFHQDTYLPKHMLYWCDKLQIDVVFGSDAHNVDSVGAHFHLYELLKSNR